ncbi:MAG: YbaB/EbfC family nucleoid-associated protein [Vulcanimicrobiaceae bacterium]
MNQAQLMAQVKKMQTEMARAQEELAATTVTGSAAGGQVKIEMTCDQRVTKISLEADVVDPSDIETLEDVLLVAFNDAIEKASQASQKRMSSVTGGMHIPGLM